MKTTKLVLGIISIVLFALVSFQSCAAGLVNSIEGNGEVSGTTGLLVSVCLLIAGIVGISTRKGKAGGSYVAGGFYLLASLLAFTESGSIFSDLKIWAGLSLIFGLVFIVGTIISNKKQQ